MWILIPRILPLCAVFFVAIVGIIVLFGLLFEVFQGVQRLWVTVLDPVPAVDQWFLGVLFTS